MIYSIASGELSIAEIWHFPISLAKTLDAFRMEEHSGEMLLDISVIRKMPEIKAAQLATPTLKIGNGKKGETLLSFSRSPQCMVETKTDKKSVVFYISETSDLADPGLAEQARVLLRMVFEDAAAKKRILSLHASAVVMNGMGICVNRPFRRREKYSEPKPAAGGFRFLCAECGPSRRSKLKKRASRSGAPPGAEKSRSLSMGMRLCRRLWKCGSTAAIRSRGWIPEERTGCC